MIRQLRSYTIPLTLQLATEVANLPKVHGERCIRAPRREMLIEALNKKLFYAPTWRVAFLNGIKYRVDGQASSTILSQLNGKFPQELNVHITEFVCDTEHDLQELFRCFDRAESTRTSGEMVHTIVQAYPELRGLKQEHTRRAVAGIVAAMCEDGNVPRHIPLDTKDSLVSQYIQFILWAMPLAKDALLTRSAVMAVVFNTWQASPEHAMRFWTLVQNNSHPDVDNPTRVLHDFLRECKYNAPKEREDRNPRNKSNQTNRQQAQWTHRGIIAKCTHAARAWRQNRTTDLKYFAEAPLPDLDWPELKGYQSRLAVMNSQT